MCWIAPLLALRCATACIHVPVRDAYRCAAGIDTTDELLTEYLPDYPVVQWANRRLPANARVLVSTWEEDTALYRPLAFRSNYWLQDSVHYDTPERLVADLRRLKVTHLVLSPMGEFCDRSTVCRGRKQHETAALDALARERGLLLFRSGDVSLYELRLPRGP